MNYRVKTSSELDIHSGPGTSYESIGTLDPGQTIISPDTADWLPVLLEDDSIGWATRKDLEEAPTTKEAPAPTPAPATTGPPLFQKELTAKFGAPKEGAGYLVTIDLREFAGHLGHVKDFEGNPWGCRIYGHKLLDAPLKQAFRLLCERGLAGELRTYDGCFNIRPMTGGGGYSVHSWGLAVDLNALLNPYGGPTRFSKEFILCFAEAGFEAGALWHTPDGMHFQLPWTQDWRQSSNPLRPRLT
jgi:D-alanyl-D-alanine carboxypeptidase